jgi:hypothetical protein
LFNPRNHFACTENIFGNTVNVNMLCLPNADRRKLELRPITSRTDWWKRQ